MQSEEARLLLARAILEKVRQARHEKASAEKAWYKGLQAFLHSKSSLKGGLSMTIMVALIGEQQLPNDLSARLYELD